MPCETICPGDTSNLWLDAPTWSQDLASRRGCGELSEGQASDLTFFGDHGFLVKDLGIEPELLDQLVKGVDDVWRSLPSDLAYACRSPARSMKFACERVDRAPGYRIHDLHSHLQAARDLYLNSQVFELAQLILGRRAVAIQSLFFEYGSEQMLHRDCVVVPTGAPGHLLAAWIALEDIEPDAGPLVYVPGSHRLPLFRFKSGSYRLDPTNVTEAEIQQGFEFEEAQCANNGLVRKPFLAKKGQVLYWHAALRHGGEPVRNPALTRRSFVIHYSCTDTYPARSITVSSPGTESGNHHEKRVFSTRKILQKDMALGYQNPMFGSDWA